MTAFKHQLVAALPELRAFARNLCGDPHLADDLVQETVMKGWAARDRFQAGSNLRAWLFTILRNSFYSNRRKAGREVEDPEGVFTGRLNEPPSHTDKLALQDFRRALMTLPEDQREALILIGASGFSHEEVAAIMGCAIGTVKSRVSRARQALNHLFDKDTVPATTIEGSAQGAFDAIMDEADAITSPD